MFMYICDDIANEIEKNGNFMFKFNEELFQLKTMSKSENTEAKWTVNAWYSATERNKSLTLRWSETVMQN